MPYSYIIDSTIADVGTPTEPVTLEQAKTYIRVSGSSEDTLITALITRARQAVELATSLCIVEKNVIVWFCNANAHFQLPYGPLKTFTSLTNNSDDEVIDATGYTLIGGQFPVLTLPAYDNLKMIYVAGYTTVPEGIKGMILDQVNYMYENRGANIDSLGYSPKVASAVLQWTRQSPIL